MVQQKPNPMDLALWAIAGTAFAIGAWFITLISLPHSHSDGSGLWETMWMNRLRIIAFAGPFIAGLAVSLFAEKRLNKAVRNETWTEAELAPVLSLVSNPLWAWGSGAILIAYLIFIVSRDHLSGGGFFYILSYPLLLTTRMRQLLTPKSTGDNALLGLQNLNPIQSEHWGKPALRKQNPPS